MNKVLSGIGILLFGGLWHLSYALAEDYPFADDFNSESLSTVWSVEKDGCMVEQVEGALHVHGTTTEGNWKRIGVSTGYVFPEGSFTASVDFKVPKFRGQGVPLIYLFADSPGGKVGIFYDYPYGHGYCVQALTTPARFSRWLFPFGNERTTYHRMKLTYDHMTETATGYVDDQIIGTVKAPMSKNVKFQLCVSTDAPRMQVDVFFDNFAAVGHVEEFNKNK